LENKAHASVGLNQSRSECWGQICCV